MSFAPCPPGEIVAVKTMEAVLDKEEDIKAELNVFQNHAHHPNIVDFHGAFVKKNEFTDDSLWLVMEVSCHDIDHRVTPSKFLGKILSLH